MSLRRGAEKENNEYPPLSQTEVALLASGQGSRQHLHPSPRTKAQRRRCVGGTAAGLVNPASVGPEPKLPPAGHGRRPSSACPPALGLPAEAGHLGAPAALGQGLVT